MGGSSEKVTVGYRYYLGVHFALCHGPIDYITRINVDDRLAWSGLAVDEQITIDAPGLFGGDEREGGIAGDVDVMMGADDQLENDYLQARFGDNIPAYRGIVSVVARRVYMGLNPYLKKWAFRAQRVFVSSGGVEQWYREKAPISSNSLVVFDSLFDYQTASNTVPPDPANWPAPTSGWTTDGQAPFGTTTPNFTPPYPINTAWAPDTGLWLRKVITVDVQKSIRIYGFVENAAFFYIDGVYVGAYNPDNDQILPPDTLYNFELTVDRSLLTVGNHTLHVYLLDEASVTPGNDVTYFYMFFGNQVDLNPAHIIRECLTDPAWGMGYPSADIDDDSFIAAADTLFDEKMGISLLWDRQKSIQDFMADILRHIDGQLYVDRISGKFVLYLIRDDYSVSDLLLLDGTNSGDISRPKRPTLGELTSGVTVKFWDFQTGSDGSTSVQDHALARLQGAAVVTNRQYPGFTNIAIANRVALRDLKALSTPILSCTIIADRSAAGLHIGEPFIINRPDADINNVVMRVNEIYFGNGKSNAVKIVCAQDVFSTPDFILTGNTSNGFTPEDALANIAVPRLVEEAQYYELVQILGEDAANDLINSGSNQDVGFDFIAAGRQGNEIKSTVWVDAGAGYVEQGALDFSPHAQLTNDLGYTDTTIVFNNPVDTDLIEVGFLAQINTETVVVRSISSDGNSVEIGRGCLDTVPVEHSADDYILFYDFASFNDGVEYQAGEQINVKIQTSTGSDLLALSDAPADSITFDSRAYRPYPPGNVQVNGEYFPEQITGQVALTWAHRDRLQQTSLDVEDFLDTNIGPEFGTTYTIRFYGEDGVTLGRTVTGLTGTSYTYLEADELADFGLVSGADVPVERSPILEFGSPTIDDSFGSGVALNDDGTILAVGMFRYDTGTANVGGVIIYDDSSSGWVQRSIVTASDGASGDGFGVNCALSNDGTVLAVGAFNRASGGTSRGGVYIYDYSSSGWTERSIITASDGVNFDQFGIGVALSGDGNILAVGAFVRESGGLNRGAVYLYDYSSSGWVERSTILIAGDGADQDRFGTSVALTDDGNTLAVGAIQWEGGTSDQGGVYIFDWSGSAWVQRGAVLEAASPESGAQFGSAVAFSSSGSVLAVGSRSFDTPADSGRVYLFDETSSAWDERDIISASDLASGDQFGQAVALNSAADVLCVGAFFWENGTSNQGGVYTYDITQGFRLNDSLRIEIESERDGYESYQMHEITVFRSSSS